MSREKTRSRILLVGGCGFIGSHTMVELLRTGLYEVHLLDSLVNSSSAVLGRIEMILGQEQGSLQPFFHQMDLTDRASVEELFQTIKFDSVIHFAALKVCI